MIILPPVGTDQLHLSIDGVPVSVDLRHGIITVAEQPEKVASSELPADVLQGIREMENNKLLSALGMS